MQKLGILLLLILTANSIFGQRPKWVDKAKKAVFSIITYDKEGKIMNNGNGFFISEDGVAVSDYSLFKGAERATIVNAEGKEMTVNSIMGANELYDVVKFQVEIGKKVVALEVAATAIEKGSTFYILPYSLKENSYITGTVKEISPIPGGFHYYSLNIPYNDKNVSCPVLNADGQAVALVQKSADGNDENSFAISASFASNLSINALSINEPALRNIGIKKALPDNADQALVYLFISSSTLNPDTYLSLLNDFIMKYPDHPEGYLRRAAFYVERQKDEKYFALAESDLKHALKLSSKKDDVHYNFAKLIYNNELYKPAFKYKDWGFGKALTEIREALSIDTLPLYRQLEGDIYFAMQDYAKAFESYEQVNHTNIASPMTYYSAAKAKEMMKGSPAEIIALLDSAISLFSYPLPVDAAPYIFERAQQKALNNQHRESIMDYNIYFELEKGDVNDLFFYYREQENYKAKLFEQALNDIQKALEIKPDDAVYLAEKGAVLLRLAKYDEAIKCLEEALVIDPKFASCYRIIGYCQLQQGKKEDACRNFAKAKELGDEAVDKLIEYNCQ